jgi:hypothetical protein
VYGSSEFEDSPNDDEDLSKIDYGSLTVEIPALGQSELMIFNDLLSSDHRSPREEECLFDLDYLVRQGNRMGPLQKSSVVKRLQRGDLPPSIRPVFWIIALGADVNYDQSSYGRIIEKSHLISKEVARQITLDVNRTSFSECPFSLTLYYKRSVFRVLVAFALLFPQIGYCQGLSYIVGYLTTVVVSEEVVFSLICRICSVSLPPDYYTRSLKGVLVDQKVLNRLVSKFCKVEKITVDVLGSTCVNWLMTLFCASLPLKALEVFFDYYVVFPEQSTFRLALGIYKNSENSIDVRQQVDQCISNMTGEGVHRILNDRVYSHVTTSYLTKRRARMRMKLEQSGGVLEEVSNLFGLT